MLLTSLIFAALLLPSLATMSSMPKTPPMKMGLWSYTTSITTYGPSGTAARPARVIKVQQCVTPETWASYFQSTAGIGCTNLNASLSGKTYTANFACSTTHTTGHVKMEFPTPESAHGLMHMDVDLNNMQIHADATVDMHFISTSCGSITPPILKTQP